jgi:hypothetical protein
MRHSNIRNETFRTFTLEVLTPGLIKLESGLGLGFTLGLGLGLDLGLRYV